MSTYDPKTRWDADISLPDPRSNRPIKLIHRIEAALMGAVSAVFSRIPIDKGGRILGRALATIGPLIRNAHRQGDRNLRLVYPDMTATERAQILKGAWENLGAIGAEFAHLDELAERTTIINEDKLAPFTVEGGQQAIFFSGHFANWEAMGVALHHANVPYGVVYRAANNPIIDEEIINRRAAAMSRWQLPKGIRGGREFFYVLSKGRSICIMHDQKFNDGISVPFLGHSAMTAVAAARITLKKDIPLVPISLVRLPGSRFELTVHDPIQIERTGDLSHDIEKTCVAMNDVIGQFVLDRPDQWLWFHRRWPKKIAG